MHVYNADSHFFKTFLFSVYPCSLYLTVLYYTTVVGDNFSIMKTTFHFNFLLFTSFPQITREALKFGDGDGSNLCRVKKSSC